MNILLQIVMLVFFYWLTTKHFLNESSRFTRFLTFLLMVGIAIVKDYYVTGSFEDLIGSVILVIANIFIIKYVIKGHSNQKQK